jgi:cytochrome c
MDWKNNFLLSNILIVILFSSIFVFKKCFFDIFLRQNHWNKIYAVTWQPKNFIIINNRPRVQIIEPENNSIHSLNSLIRYSVNVSDVEDGESKYDEIPASRVLMEVKFREGKPPNFYQEDNKLKEEPVGLIHIMNSDCFTCHQFKNKMIGPSFQEIAHKYSGNKSERESLANRIREGSSGIWGDIAMPAHRDLSSDEAEYIIDWILKNGANPGLNYLVGIEGTFKLNQPESASNGHFVLRAIYTDRGLPDKPEEKLT